jgi:hypothetical protein
MDYSLKEILNIFERNKYPMAGHSGRAVPSGADKSLAFLISPRDGLQRNQKNCSWMG